MVNELRRRGRRRQGEGRLRWSHHRGTPQWQPARSHCLPRTASRSRPGGRRCRSRNGSPCAASLPVPFAPESLIRRPRCRRCHLLYRLLPSAIVRSKWVATTRPALGSWYYRGPSAFWARILAVPNSPERKLQFGVFPRATRFTDHVGECIVLSGRPQQPVDALQAEFEGQVIGDASGARIDPSACACR